MTILVQVKNKERNEDSDADLNVSVDVLEIDKDTGARSVSESVTLKPGESRSFHIHLLRDLLVSEVKPT